MPLPPPQKTSSLPPPSALPPARSASSLPQPSRLPAAPSKPLPWKIIIPALSAVALGVAAWIFFAPPPRPDEAIVRAVLNDFAKKLEFAEFGGIDSLRYDDLNEPGKILGTVSFKLKFTENIYATDPLRRQRWLDDLEALRAQNAELWPKERITISAVPPSTLVVRHKQGDTVSVRAQLAVEKVGKEWNVKVADVDCPVRGDTLASYKSRLKVPAYVIEGDSATDATLAQWERDFGALRDKLKTAREGHDANMKMWQDELKERFAEGTVYEGTPRVDNRSQNAPIRFTVEKFIDDGRVIVGKFENLRYAPDWGRVRIITAITQDGFATKAEWLELAKTDSEKWPDPDYQPFYRWFVLARGTEAELLWSRTDATVLAFNNKGAGQRLDLKKVNSATEK